MDGARGGVQEAGVTARISASAAKATKKRYIEHKDGRWGDDRRSLLLLEGSLSADHRLFNADLQQPTA